jgi:hypothetical protein
MCATVRRIWWWCKDVYVCRRWSRYCGCPSDWFLSRLLCTLRFHTSFSHRESLLSSPYRRWIVSGAPRYGEASISPRFVLAAFHWGMVSEHVCDCFCLHRSLQCFTKEKCPRYCRSHRFVDLLLMNGEHIHELASVGLSLLEVLMCCHLGARSCSVFLWQKFQYAFIYVKCWSVACQVQLLILVW